MNDVGADVWNCSSKSELRRSRRMTILMGDLSARLKVPGFAKELMTGGRLVGPILLGQLAQMLAPLIDTVMAGRVSPEDLSAVALGNSLWVAVLLFAIGLLGAIQPLVSNAFGGRRYAAIVPLFQSGVLLSVVLTLIGLVTVQLAPHLLMLSGADANLVGMAVNYYEGIGFGMLPCFLLFAARGYCEGLGNTKIFMILWSFMALINIPFNAVLIYGYGPIPALGGVGCGYATAIVNWLGLFAFLIWARHQQLFDLTAWGVSHISKFSDLNKERFMSALLSIIRVGLPSAFHLLVEGSMFSGLAVLMAVFGAEVIAANQIALNITSFLFMIPLSFSFAYTIRIAYNRGAGNLSLVNSLAKSSLWLVALIGSAIASFVLYYGEYVVRIYSDNASVVSLSCLILVMSAFYVILDVAQVIFVGILKGFEDTKVPMWITIFALWCIGIPVGFIVARTDLLGPPLGPVGLWFGIVVGMFVSATLLFFRLTIVLRQMQKSALPEVAAPDDSRLAKCILT